MKYDHIAFNAFADDTGPTGARYSDQFDWSSTGGFAVPSELDDATAMEYWRAQGHERRVYDFQIPAERCAILVALRNKGHETAARALSERFARVLA